MKFRKKPVVIEAIHWTGINRDEIDEFMLGRQHFYLTNEFADKVVHLFIKTLEGNLEALPSDWIIKGIKGEFYPCKPDIFEDTYEQVDEECHDD
jgi:hypothetical protein